LNEWAEKNMPFAQIILSEEFILIYILFFSYIFYGYYTLNIFKIFGSKPSKTMQY